MDVYEFEVWLSTSDALKAGVLDLDRRKYLIAETSSSEAYEVAVAMAWREDRPSRDLAPWSRDYWQVTKVWFVP